MVRGRGLVAAVVIPAALLMGSPPAAVAQSDVTVTAGLAYRVVESPLAGWRATVGARIKIPTAGTGNGIGTGWIQPVPSCWALPASTDETLSVVRIAATFRWKHIPLGEYHSTRALHYRGRHGGA